MSPEREREYKELGDYLGFFWTHVMGADPNDPIHPSNVGNQIAARFGRSKALDGLKQAVNDSVEMLCDSPPAQIEELDDALRKQGFLTFSEIRRRYSSSYKRILKHKRIKTETEYYLIAGVLADVSSNADKDERSELEQLIAEYSVNA